MTTEIRMLLLVRINIVWKQKDEGGEWEAFFSENSKRITGKTWMEANRNYLDWVEFRVLSADSDEAIAKDFGINPSWIPQIREDVVSIQDKKQQ